jgi:hypothetical protein
MENLTVLVQYVLTVPLRLEIAKLVHLVPRTMFYVQTVLTDITHQLLPLVFPAVRAIPAASCVQTMEPVLNAILLLATS